MTIIEMWKAKRKAKRKRGSDNIKYFMCGMAYQHKICNRNCDSCGWKVKEAENE